jgi:hypothetical protein
VPNYPYISGQGAIVQTFAQLRKGVPPKIDAGYLQRFKIAQANESYVISILRFLGLIDDEGNTVEGKTGFLYGGEESFRAGLEDTVKAAYAPLFGEMPDALEAQRDDLIHWFRTSDKTSAVVGLRQAGTFLTLAALAGRRELPAARTTNGAAKKTAAAPAGTAKKATVKKAATKEEASSTPPAEQRGPALHVNGKGNGHDVGLTVRIEVNLPAGGDADTYDAIFASIKKHLMS